jgi:hypothetical protein
MLKQSAILERVFESDGGDFPPDLARHILGLNFPDRDHHRYEELSGKAQAGSLSDDDKAELEDYLNVDDLLIILRAKAEKSLARHGPRA